jgi:hypothetical protein
MKKLPLILPALYVLVYLVSLIAAAMYKNNEGGVFFVYYAHWPASILTGRVAGWLRSASSLSSDVSLYVTSFVFGVVWYYAVGKLVLALVCRFRSSSP